MNTKRIVIGSQSKFIPEGTEYTVEAVEKAVSATNKPSIEIEGWLDLGPIKWTLSPSHKTEDYMTPEPGAYVMSDEIVLSKGLTLKGKLEKQSNFAVQLQEACQALPAAPTAGGVHNPLAGSPVVKGWLHIQRYDQNNVLVGTWQYWVSLRASGDTNHDDKAAETPIEAKVLFSTLNVGDLE